MADGTLALSMPGLFLTCVQYFTLVQLGRNFGNDFGSCLLQLQAAELRLQRWGKAAGITEDGFAAKLEAKYPPKDVQFAGNALKQIEKQLRRAQEDSVDIVALEHGSDQLELADEVQQLDIAGSASVKRAYRAVARLKSEYQKSLRGAGKAVNRTRWALYKRTELVGLVTRIEEHVLALETLFPEQEKALAEGEAKSLDQETIEALAPAAAAADPLLANALRAVAEQRGYQLFEGITNEGRANVRLGNDYRTTPEYQGQQIFRNMVNQGNATVHAGNRFG